MIFITSLHLIFSLLQTVIRGPERAGVLSARSRIELIVESARRRSRPTHFVSIPLSCEATRERFLDFKDLILQECSKVCQYSVLPLMPFTNTCCTILIYISDQRFFAIE